MKYLIVLVMLFCTVAMGRVPFNIEEENRFNDIETVANGKILVGNASNVGTEVTVSGDATMDNTGALTVAAGSIEESMLAVPTADGKNASRIIRANLDCTASSCVIGTVSMVQTLPANALIIQTWMFFEEQFVDAGSGTVALHCQDANNIFTAADITGNSVGAIVSGNSTGIAGDMVAAIDAQCTITATITTIEQTAGIITLYVEYVVTD